MAHLISEKSQPQKESLLKPLPFLNNKNSLSGEQKERETFGKNQELITQNFSPLKIS